MCGIAGVIGDFPKPEAERALQAMLAAQGHRGPDDSGFASWNFGPNAVALGNTRLSVLDLSPAGHQPMTERSERYWTVFNGEIYNFAGLRRLLDPDRTVFRTLTDTEVILNGYSQWAQDAFRRFHGMFAFALLDTKARLLHLVRDPLGIKPLYYYASPGRLVFASELSALVASGCVPRRADTRSLSSYLECGWVGASGAAVAGVRLLEPGQVLTADLATSNLHSRLSTYEPAQPPPSPVEKDRNQAAAHMLYLLEQSVKYHLVSDVPVALFLSGGVDSSVLLHLMCRAGCGSPNTFTVAFPDVDLNEGRHAARIARHYGAAHHQVDLTDSDVLGLMPAALCAMDQPTMDGVNTFVISHAVHAAGIKVALSGLGSDELFAGYPSFRRARWAKAVSTVPRRVRGAVSAFGRIAPGGRRHHKLWDFLESDCVPSAVYRVSRQLFSQAEISELVPGYDRSVPAPSPTPSGDAVNDISRLEVDEYMTGLLLRDTDCMSMANSLEVRVPFVDKAVMRYAMGMPGRWKVASSIPKRFLLDAMRGGVPPYVWQRPKMGFVLPFDRWMRTVLRREIEATITDRSLAQTLGLHPEAVAKVWSRFVNGSLGWSRPWSLYVLMRWSARNRVAI
jgi:asparagine synthase (glutamine-hydrolysing)